MALSGSPRVTTVKQDDPRPGAKPFDIPKRLIWNAWKRVAANKGAPGVDMETIEAFQNQLGGNLYKLWNRMSSGSYHPKPVRQVLIPKSDGGTRALGIPPVVDRTAQMAVKMVLEPRLEQIFHANSFGYRPGRSAKDAVAKARQNCWRFDWVLDLDIKSFFDTIDHDLLMRAVEKHVPEKWIRLYIKRWLETPVLLVTGEMEARTCGSPQGAVISPLLANLYLHYAFDQWMGRHHSNIPFERYADDVVCHCRSEDEAQTLLVHLGDRLANCKLQLHPTKTQIIYCKDGKRRRIYARTRFDFLGFTFQARSVQDRQGNLFVGFNPSVSRAALKRMNQAIRNLDLNRRTWLTLGDLAKRLNPLVRGWVAYYGSFYPEPLKRFLIRIDLRLGCWCRNKYKRMRRHKRRSWAWLRKCRETSPMLFVHWDYIYLKGRG